jgi:hypothetical protein
VSAVISPGEDYTHVVFKPEITMWEAMPIGACDYEAVGVLERGVAGRLVFTIRRGDKVLASMILPVPTVSAALRIMPPESWWPRGI